MLATRAEVHGNVKLLERLASVTIGDLAAVGAGAIGDQLGHLTADAAQAAYDTGVKRRKDTDSLFDNFTVRLVGGGATWPLQLEFSNPKLYTKFLERGTIHIRAYGFLKLVARREAPWIAALVAAAIRNYLQTGDRGRR